MMTSQTRARIERIKANQRRVFEDYKKGKIDWDVCCDFQMEGDEMIEQLTGVTEDDYMEAIGYK